MSATQLQRLLDFAAAEVGKGEEGANNAGPYVESLHRGARASGNWCAAFVAHCLEAVSVCPPIPDRKRRGAKALAKYVAEELSTGLWVARPRYGRAPTLLDHPLPGDIIAWHRSPGASGWQDLWRDWRGHVGLVEDVRLVPGGECEIATIEGNVGRFPATVRRRTYSERAWTRRLYGIARLEALHMADNWMVPRG